MAKKLKSVESFLIGFATSTAKQHENVVVRRLREIGWCWWNNCEPKKLQTHRGFANDEAVISFVSVARSKYRIFRLVDMAQ
jgi:hypothetical protein